MAAATLVKVPRTVEINTGLNPFVAYSAPANAMDNSGVQDIFTLDVEGTRRVCIHLVVATNALAACTILAAPHRADTTWMNIASIATDYTAPHAPIAGASGSLVTLAVGGGWVIIDTTGLSTIKIQANSSNAGGSTLAIDAGASTI